MREQPAAEEDRTGAPAGRPVGAAARLLVAFGIGAALGFAVAALSVPERRRSRLPELLDRQYRRVRRASGAALGEIRTTGRRLARDLREEMGASLEAAREQLGEMTRDQLRQLIKGARRKRRRPHR
jgi:hypothetical protein